MDIIDFKSKKELIANFLDDYIQMCLTCNTSCSICPLYDMDTCKLTEMSVCELKEAEIRIKEWTKKHSKNK